MGTAQIRQQLHNYIDTADERKLKAIFTLLETDLNNDFGLTDEQKEELDQRYENYLSGTGQTYTWEETIAKARQSVSGSK